MKQHANNHAPWNYLRVRGEYDRIFPGWHEQMELPPRARRIPRSSTFMIKTPRTTSACAENTRATLYMAPPHGNYLRVRGEYPRARLSVAHHTELPPRARRIHSGEGDCGDLDGTTSACAENTAHMWANRRPRRNYLRVRGEYRSSGLSGVWIEELPPRARRIP